eukprot:g17036.t1
MAGGGEGDRAVLGEYGKSRLAGKGLVDSGAAGIPVLTQHRARLSPPPEATEIPRGQLLLLYKYRVIISLRDWVTEKTTNQGYSRQIETGPLKQYCANAGYDDRLHRVYRGYLK